MELSASAVFGPFEVGDQLAQDGGVIVNASERNVAPVANPGPESARAVIVIKHDPSATAANFAPIRSRPSRNSDLASTDAGNCAGGGFWPQYLMMLRAIFPIPRIDLRTVPFCILLLVDIPLLFHLGLLSIRFGASLYLRSLVIGSHVFALSRATLVWSKCHQPRSSRQDGVRDGSDVSSIVAVPLIAGAAYG